MLSNAYDLSVDILRYYERVGVIPPVSINHTVILMALGVQW